MYICIYITSSLNYSIIFYIAWKINNFLTVEHWNSKCKRCTVVLESRQFKWKQRFKHWTGTNSLPPVIFIKYRNSLNGSNGKRNSRNRVRKSEMVTIDTDHLQISSLNRSSSIDRSEFVIRLEFIQRMRYANRTPTVD